MRRGDLESFRRARVTAFRSGEDVGTGKTKAFGKNRAAQLKPGGKHHYR